MKATNLTKRIFAFGLSIALLVTGSGLLCPSVLAAKKAKAPKISKKKATVTVGKTLKLSVKNATKKVKWSTSNKKVAKVKKTSGKKKANVVIKAVKAGKATITAKVGKKKLKCKVTVKKKTVATNIKSVSVDPVDRSSVVLQLKKATVLNAADVEIAVKDHENGKFNQTVKVKNMTSTDQQTWRLYLDDYISNGEWVKVTIGKNTKTVQNKLAFYGEEDNSTILLEKNKVVNNDLDELDLDYYFYNSIGTVKYELKEGTLPDGLVLSSKRAQIKGVPTTVGNSVVTIEATDEMGRKATTVLSIKVYDNKSIASADKVVDLRLDDYVADRLQPSPMATAVPGYSPEANKNYSEISIAPRGGSGTYTFALAAPADVAGVSLSTDKMDEQTKVVTAEKASATKLCIPYGITAGVHTYTVNITDAADPACKSTAVITVNVNSYYNVSGVVADVAGNMPQGDELYFIPKDANSFNEYISQRTYIKYDLNGIRCGGNLLEGYDASYWNLDNDQSDDLYSVYNYDYSAKIGPFPMPELEREPAPSPAATTEPVPVLPAQNQYKAPTVDAGKYTTELPAGEYIVKMYSSATGTYYHMDNTVTVGTADAEAALTLPVRYTTVSGTATYANVENPIGNHVIHFELKDNQYKLNDSYAVETDYRGKFSASLPVGTYVAYMFDEKGEPQYFTTDVIVGETAVALNDFKLTITRYAVEGTIYETVVDNYETGETHLEELYYRDVYVYMPDGTYKSVTTDYNGQYKLYLEGGNPAKTYTFRTNLNGDYRTLGTVSVGTANQTIAGNNPVNLTVNFATETANAVGITQLGTAVSLSSTGNNDVWAKYTPAETGEYKFAVKFINGVMVTLYNSDGDEVRFEDSKLDEGEYILTVNMTEGQTYYLQLVSFADGYYDFRNQTKDNMSVTVTKNDKTAEFASAVEITTAATESAPLVVNTSKHDDKKTYVKLAVEAGKQYTINLTNTTIGVEGISYEIYNSNGDHYDDGNIYDNKDQITVFANETGVYYISLNSYGYDGYYEETIDLAATLKLSLTVAE